jgi:hypothetical protein
MFLIEENRVLNVTIPDAMVVSAANMATRCMPVRENNSAITSRMPVVIPGRIIPRADILFFVPPDIFSDNLVKSVPRVIINVAGLRW